MEEIKSDENNEELNEDNIDLLDNIFLGSSNLTDIYIGNNKISAVYVGNTKVWG